MKRILITGNAGSGKTYLSKQLHSVLGIQYYSLDSIVWEANWKVSSKHEIKSRVMELINKDEWIIDGVSKMVQDAADCVIFLDCSRFTSLIRTFKRNLPYMFKPRPGFPDGCAEIKILPRLIAIIWNFPNKVKPGILQRLIESENQKNYQLKSKTDVIRFLENNFLV